MEWYAPVAILPSLGLIILSTSNFIVSLNTEIGQIEHENPNRREIILAKLKQLKRLGIANAFLYGSILLFLLAGLSNAFTENPTVGKGFMIFGVITTTIALIFLFTHAIKSISIRQKHLKL